MAIVDMSLEDLGNIGDFVGGLLLAISLLYLATQIRQNTKSSRAEAYQDAVDKINNWSTLFVHEKSHSGLFYRGLRSHSSLEPEERSQFYHLMMIYLRSYAAAKHLEENNLLTKSVTEGYEGGLKDMFKEPEMLDWLSKHEHTIDSETVLKVRDLLRSKSYEE